MRALTQDQAEKIATDIYLASTPVLQIYGLGGRRWRRNVPPDDHRYGPWLQGQYRVLDKATWSEKTPCIYLVAGGRDQQTRYVGRSQNRMRDRWRESPAIDHETGMQIEHQLFHSQCWRQIEAEYLRTGTSEYEVRCMPGKRLATLLGRLGQPLPGLTDLDSDAEDLVIAIERWMCSHSSKTFLPWNIAMAGSKR